MVVAEIGMAVLSSPVERHQLRQHHTVAMHIVQQSVGIEI